VGDQALSSGSFGVGTYDVATTDALRGRIDDLRIYHAVLSSQAASLEVLLDVYAAIMADSFTSASDARLKKNIVTLNGALDNLQTLRGVYHDWNDPNQSEDRQIGVIAQEIQEVYPELVTVGGNGFLSVNYPKLTAVLLQSIKELHVKHNQDVQELKEMIQALSASPTASATSSASSSPAASPSTSPATSPSTSPATSPRSHSSHSSHSRTTQRKKHASHNKTSKSHASS
jgi:hypothetical protein